MLKFINILPRFLGFGKWHCAWRSFYLGHFYTSVGSLQLYLVRLTTYKIPVPNYIAYLKYLLLLFFFATAELCLIPLVYVNMVFNTNLAQLFLLFKKQHLDCEC